jgi:hypothetical protein
MADTDLHDCHDCGAKPGEFHQSGCDVERCARCGHQAIACNCIYEVCGMDVETMEFDHPDVYTGGPTQAMQVIWAAQWGHKRLPWTGKWPGEAECEEFGWYCKEVPGKGWMPCDKDDPDCKGGHLNRLYAEAVWDANLGRFVRREQLN